MVRALPTQNNRCQRPLRKATDATWKISNNVKIQICEDIESKLSVSKSGRYPRGSLKEILDLQLSLHGSWLTCNMIMGLLQRRRAKRKAALKDSISSTSNVEESAIDVEEAPSDVPDKPVVHGRPKGSTKLYLYRRRNGLGWCK